MAVGFLCFVAGTALLIALAVRAGKDPEAVSSCAYYGEKAEKMKAEADAEAEAKAKAETEAETKTETETEAEPEAEAEEETEPEAEKTPEDSHGDDN